MITESGAYDSFNDFLDEFFPDDPAARERIERGAERLGAEERGARLVELRERARATREDVARRMGVELQRVIDLEAGATGFSLHYVDELARTGPDEGDEELRALAGHITQLSSYIQAIGGDIHLEVSGAAMDVVDPETGEKTIGAGPFSVPVPADSLSPDMIYTMLRNKPSHLVIWAEVEGWRTDIVA